MTDAQDKATTNADKIIASINQNIAGIDEDIRQLQQLVTDNPNDTEIADKLADAQQQLADATSSLSDAEAQKDAIANAETLADITDINNALSHDDASAGVDKEMADQDLADAQAKSAENLAAAKSAAKQDLTDDIAAIQDDVDETQRIVDRLSDIAAKNPGDSEIGAALTNAQNQLDKAESALADAKDQLATVDDAKTLAQVDEKTAAGDADVAAAEAARQAADTDLQNAGAKSADNLNNAIADVNKQADANLAAIQENIEQIKDDIAALSKIAADNPNGTKIADLLADANKQLTEAQGRYKDAQADKDALAQATTLAEVSDLTDDIADKTTAADVDRKQADQDLANAKTTAADDLADAKEAAKDAIQQQLDRVDDEIKQIQKDIDELTQLAKDHPNTPEVQQALDDAKQQLADAKDAKDTIVDQLIDVNQAKTADDAKAINDVAQEAGEKATDAVKAADKDVADAKKAVADDMANAKSEAEDAVRDKINELRDDASRVQDIVDQLQDLVNNHPGNQDLADKLAEAKDQLNKVQSALEDARAQLVAIETAETPAQIDAATNQIGVDQVVGNQATQRAEQLLREAQDIANGLSTTATIVQALGSGQSVPQTAMLPYTVTETVVLPTQVSGIAQATEAVATQVGEQLPVEGVAAYVGQRLLAEGKATRGARIQDRLIKSDDETKTNDARSGFWDRPYYLGGRFSKDWNLQPFTLVTVLLFSMFLGWFFLPTKKKEDEQ